MIAPEYPKIANFDAKNWPKHGNFRGKKTTNSQRNPDINWMVLWHWLYHIIPIGAFRFGMGVAPVIIH